MAVTHGAMFHLAAARHFAGQDVARPPYPTVPLGPTPQQLLGQAVLGFRHPVTLPPDGGEATRPPGIVFEDGSMTTLDIDIPRGWSTVISDDHG